MSRSFVPHLRSQGSGHVVNTASMAAFVAGPLYAPYISTKAAIVGLSETLWHELRAEDSPVGVSVLCPGAVESRLHDNERLRPAVVRESLDRASMADTRGLRDHVPGVSRRMPVERIAIEVLDAVRQDRFYVLTHPEDERLLHQRAAALRDGQVPVGWGDRATD